MSDKKPTVYERFIKQFPSALTEPMGYGLGEVPTAAEDRYNLVVVKRDARATTLAIEHHHRSKNNVFGNTNIPELRFKLYPESKSVVLISHNLGLARIMGFVKPKVKNEKESKLLFKIFIKWLEGVEEYKSRIASENSK